ncbi:MAG TPA: LamG domain-containing protein, partial [Candidatus Micrarchaeota archaeon]|nr:LamG domain-containing protein [Candidatus Micrarchaeota archaeon]
NVYYAGGGGGSIVCPGSGSNGAGGLGGGGTGYSAAGSPNTGGGGGGGAYAGGSGIVIVRYLTSLSLPSSSDVPYSLSAISGGQFLVIKNGVAYTVNSSVPINDNVWHHVVATYDNATMRIYVDGSLAGSAAYGFGALPANGLPVFIGRNYDSWNASGYFNGTIDEAAIFNRSLNASEIQQMYNYTKDGLGTYFTVPLGAAATFGGSSTNLSTVPDPANVTDLILEKPGKGKIHFPPTHSVNTVAQDYDRNVVIDTGFVSVNSSGLDPTFNSSTTITINATGLYSGAGVPGLKYYPGFASNRNTILSSGVNCAAPRCTGLSWNSTSQILTFNVTGFSGYALYDNSSGNLTFIGWTNNATLGINITSTNQIAVYTSNGANDSTFNFVPVTPPAAGSITLMSNETTNTTGGELGFLVENQGNVNVSITVASDKNASGFI